MFSKNVLAILTTIVFVLSLVVIQGQALAQWTNPSQGPGGGGTITPLTNPLGVDLQLGSHNITDVTNITATGNISATGSGKIIGSQICLPSASPATNCKSAWPLGDVTNPMGRSLDAGKYQIFNIESLTGTKPSQVNGLSATAGVNTKSDGLTVGVYATTLDSSRNNPSYAIYGRSATENRGGVGVYGESSGEGWGGYFKGQWGLGVAGDVWVEYDEKGKYGGDIAAEKSFCFIKNGAKGDCISSWPTPAGGTLTGSGISGRLSKWSSISNLTNSQIWDNGTGVGIGTGNNPVAKLEIDMTTLTGTEGLHISRDVAASHYSYLNIENELASPIFKVHEDGKVGIGVSAPAEALDVNGTVKALAFLYGSDRNLKKNIQTITNPLEKIKSLRGVSFNWKDTDEPSLGFIAQEVEQVLPELVKGQEGSKSLQYGNITAVLVEAVKEQQKQIEALQTELNKLKIK